MINAAGTAVLAIMLATVARADDTPQRVEVVGKLAPTRDCRPSYPDAAARSGAQGATILAFQVDGTGKVTGVDVAHSSGLTREHRMLDAAAAAALARRKTMPRPSKPLDNAL